MQRQRGYVDGELSRTGTAMIFLVVIAVITFANRAFAARQWTGKR